MWGLSVSSLDPHNTCPGSSCHPPLQPRMCQSRFAWATPCWMYGDVRGREFMGALLIVRQNRHWRLSSRLWTFPKSTQTCWPDQDIRQMLYMSTHGQCSVEDGAVGTIQWRGHSPPSSFNLTLTSESSISSNGSAFLLISVFNNTYIQGLFMNSSNFFFQKKIFWFLFLLYFLYQINYVPELQNFFFFPFFWLKYHGIILILFFYFFSVCACVCVCVCVC